MKYIKFIFIFLLSLSMVQLAVAQNATTDENGRALDATTTSTTVTDDNQDSSSIDQEEFRKKGHDFDEVEATTTSTNDKTDLVFPDDFEDLQAEMGASGFVSSKKIQAQLNTLQEELAELRQYNELLRLENRAIRRSLGSCCTEVQDGLTAKDAYLLQNAPNPFNGSSDIEFFIPQEMENVKIEVRDLKGVLLKAFDIAEAGMGKITLNAEDASSGTFLYTLVINNEIIDSKVMILSR